MPIRFVCEKCGKNLRAPDGSEGKKVRCPTCDNLQTIPLEEEPVYEAEEVAKAGQQEDEEEGAENGEQKEDEKDGESRRPCPACGEMILTTALKCRYCGEIFDKTLKRAKKKKKKRRSYGDEEDLTGGDWAVAILCSGIGCIVGLVWALQGKPKGWKMVGVSMLSSFFWGVVRTVITLAAQQGGR